MSSEQLIVTVDGPAGAGKSTVARRLAERLGYVLLDTGALYRTVALAAQRRQAAWADEPAVAEVARDLVERDALQLRQAAEAVAAEAGGSGVQVLLEGEDVSTAIRTAEMSSGASQISALPAVRAALLELQRQLGRAGGVVVEGRDIGTVVFPEAPAKFFLTASLEVRARRRHDELCARADAPSYDETLVAVRDRDRADRQREVAPLRQADDAVLVDSSDRTVDQVVDQMAALVQQRQTGR